MSPRSWCSILGPSMDCGNVRGSCMPCFTDGYRRSWAMLERSTRAVQHKSTVLLLWWRGWLAPCRGYAPRRGQEPILAQESYPHAGHAFFSDTRPSYRPEVAYMAWGRCLE